MPKVNLEGRQQVALQNGGSDPTRAHDQIRPAVDSAACHLFDKAGQSLPRLGCLPMAASGPEDYGSARPVSEETSRKRDKA